MKITLIRHGKTAMNAQGRYNGLIDEELSPLGIAEAKRAIPNMEVRRLYVSPLLRARQTGAILFPAAEQIVVDDLREMYFGECDGKSEAEMVHLPGFLPWNPNGPIMPYPGGETIDEVSERACAAVDEIALRHNGEDDHEYAITHGGVFMAIMYRHDKAKRQLIHWHTSNMCGFTFTLGKNGLKDGILDVQPYYSPGIAPNPIDELLDRSWQV